MVIRTILSADIPQIKLLISKWWLSEDGQTDAENIEFQIALISKSLETPGEDGGEQFAVAVDGEEVVGIIGYDENPRSSIRLHGRSEHPLQLSVLMVSKTQTKRGIGSLLLAWLENRARHGGFSEIILTSSVRWKDSWSFYLRHRYADMGEIQGGHTRIFSKIFLPKVEK